MTAECPVCSGPMWDETKSKFFKPGKPIAKCKNKDCNGVLWAPKNGTPAPAAAPQSFTAGPHIPDLDGPALTHGAMVTEKLKELMSSYDLCFLHAVGLASKVEKVGTVVTLEGVSAIAATLFIAAREKGLA